MFLTFLVYILFITVLGNSADLFITEAIYLGFSQ